MRRNLQRRGAAGFTLVEVLVALFAMAILSGFSWRALDGVMRTRDASRAVVDRTARLATVLTQWEQDLQAVHDTAAVPALAFDGQTLRLTRRMEGGVALVAWSVRQGHWQRWAGPPQASVGGLQEHWLRSQQFQGTEPGHLNVADEAGDWQIYFYRGNGWSNAQSTGDAALPPAVPASGVLPPREALPTAVRLVISLGGAKLTRDIALGPGGG
ncbi:General secretion pathway protein J [Rubrivivax sp. A210]|uniref:PulJ/GspJ family protein n=1 Tax=Rubrivivax sp. A210 TaxID=2772301 RepID=UPI00191B5B13|nr:prepilin-type N-terminal cleavage/methylation domain-containing protein [Rubrivivax sp. A210]CAD5372569.1 General secretion pathway protein J [Rubrivivax sp. A210]